MTPEVMPMRAAFAAVLSFAYVVGAFAAPAPAARADTFPMVAGMQTNGNVEPLVFNWNYFAEGAIGMSKRTSSQAHYVQPVYWRTFPSGNRSVTIRGKRTTAAGEMFCNLMVFDQNGFVVSQNFAAFPTVGAY